MSLTIASTAFPANGAIPAAYTCEGDDRSPPLAWSGAPPGTRSFALVVDDPDAPDPAAPRMTWVHWVLFNIPADVSELAENVPPDKKLANGARHGMNDFRKYGYGGPCPPSGTHRYYFKVFALDTDLALEPGITKADLEKAMKGHILAQGQLMGKYKRQ